MAVALHFSGPGQWTLIRDDVPAGKLHRTRQNIIFALFDHKPPLTADETAQLHDLVQHLVLNPKSIEKRTLAA
jgi:hypothetical protein